MASSNGVKFKHAATPTEEWGLADVVGHGLMLDGETFTDKNIGAKHLESAIMRAVAREYQSSTALRNHMLVVQMRGCPDKSYYMAACRELLAAYDAVERNILLQTVKENHGDPAPVQAPDRIGAEIPDP